MNNSQSLQLRKFNAVCDIQKGNEGVSSGYQMGIKWNAYQGVKSVQSMRTGGGGERRGAVEGGG